MRIKQKISNILKKETNILFAYIFGSYARKEARKESDIDIAIFLKNLNIIENDPKFEVRLALKIEKVIDIPVDVRIMNDKPLSFINQILKHGIILFSRNEKERISFEVRMFDLYTDFQYLMKEYDEKRFERYGIR